MYTPVRAFLNPSAQAGGVHAGDAALRRHAHAECSASRDCHRLVMLGEIEGYFRGEGKDGL